MSSLAVLNGRVRRFGRKIPYFLGRAFIFPSADSRQSGDGPYIAHSISTYNNLAFFASTSSCHRLFLEKKDKIRPKTVHTGRTGCFDPPTQIISDLVNMVVTTWYLVHFFIERNHTYM